MISFDWSVHTFKYTWLNMIKAFQKLERRGGGGAGFTTPPQFFSILNHNECPKFELMMESTVVWRWAQRRVRMETWHRVKGQKLTKFWFSVQIQTMKAGPINSFGIVFVMKARKYTCKYPHIFFLHALDTNHAQLLTFLHTTTIQLCRNWFNPHYA